MPGRRIGKGRPGVSGTGDSRRFSVAARAEQSVQTCYPMLDPTLIVILVVVLVLLGVGVFLFLRSRKPVEEEYQNVNCPKCRRKLRYKTHQAGKPGACPRCGERFKFPGVPKA
jgi:ssDNA-binding Zn-finger/Zn-ribbon topoisomerase 1